MNILTGLWKKLIHNAGLKILSLILGVLIWIVVVGIDNPVKTQIFTSIPVNVENEESMEKDGKFFEVAESSRTVSVSVRAERSILDQLSRDNFVASINLEDYNNGRVPILVRATRYADRIVSITPRSTYASVIVEDLGQKQFGIEAEITGDVPDGYSIGGSVINNNIVRVNGPQSVVESIERAVVRVSVQGMTRDIRTDSTIIFYDKDGETVNTANLELSRTETGITVEIWKNKSVPVVYGYTGIPADGFAATGNIIATLNELTVTGPREALNEVDSVKVPGTAIDITGATGNVTVNVILDNYLPDDVAAVNDDEGDVTANVTIEIQELSTINVEVPVSNITIDNVPQGMTAMLSGVGEVIPVSVRGLGTVLSEINPAMITGRIDMNEVAVQQNIDEWTAGSYEAAVSFTYPEGVYSGNTVVAVRVILRPDDSVVYSASGNGFGINDSEGADQ